MKKMDALRRSLVLSIALGFFLLSIVVVSEPAAAAAHTWTTDMDWWSGTLDPSLAVVGTGEPSYIELVRGIYADWTQKSPSVTPPNRDGYCLAWIAYDNSFLMFGGRGSSGMLNDTWSYNLTSDVWIRLTLTVAPSPRSRMGCAYDHANEVLVLFGGLDDASVWSQDTWWFDPVTDTWIPRSPGGDVPANLGYTPMTYDIQAGKILTFAGNLTSSSMETWAYNAAADAWTNRNPTGTPPFRDGHVITYEAQTDETLLFSGADGPTMYCDFWYYSYTQNRWLYIRDCAPGVDPNPRVGHGMTFHAGVDAVVMLGGYDGAGGYPPETWLFTSTPPQVNGTPFGRRDIMLAHSDIDDTTLLFGGYRDVDGLLNDTWALVGGGHLPNGTWTSDVWDTSSSLVNYEKIWFNQTLATSPPGTTLRFRIATANNSSGPWIFCGPGGFPGTYYTLPGQSIDPIHDHKRYLRVRAHLIGSPSASPRLEDISIMWMNTSSPWIVDTNPADRQTLVSLDASIWINFSEPMDIVTVNWTIAPAITLKAKWYNVNQTLLLTHVAPFQVSTAYTVHIKGKDANDGRSLVPGPVPNPWTISTVASIPPPGNLTVTIVGWDVVLSWDPVLGATSYCVLESSNSSAPFPCGWTLLGAPSSSPFVVVGHGSDGLTHFYIVRVCGGIMEGSNSTMGMKKAFSFTHSPTTSNIHWFQFPYNSTYKKASDISNELGPSKIDVVGKWDPAMQRATVYYYARGMWRGTDFTINPGDGLYLSILQSFLWNITGTDANVTLSFTLNPPPMKNVNWVGIPYTGIYSKASDISSELTSSKIHEVGLWNPITQTSIRWYWNGTAWTGTDFTFVCGEGIYIIVISDFTWTPTLITPVVA